jgi:hypothetical protein
LVGAICQAAMNVSRAGELRMMVLSMLRPQEGYSTIRVLMPKGVGLLCLPVQEYR